MADSHERVVEAVQSSDSELARAIGVSLRTLRQTVGISLQDMAVRLGSDEASLRALEERADVHISLLERYVSGLGARLRLVAAFEPALGSEVEETLHLVDPTSDPQLTLPLFNEHPQSKRSSVVLSIRPIYSEKILNGEKTVELRRRFPATVAGNPKALIYSTSPTQALVGSAEITAVERLPINEIWATYNAQACIAKDEFEEYFSGLVEGYALRLRFPVRLQRAVPLPELRKRFAFSPPQSFAYATEGLQRLVSHDATDLLN